MREEWLGSALARARRYRWAVVVGCVVIVAAALPFARRTAINPDVLDLLPRQGGAVRAFQSFLVHFGTLERLYLVFEAPPDNSIGEHRDYVDRYVEALRRAPEIARTEGPLLTADRDWTYLLDHQLLLLSGPQLDEALARFKPPAIDTALLNARDRLSLPSGAMKSLVRQDPLGLLSILREHLGPDTLALAPLQTQEGIVSADGRMRLVIAVPTQPPFDTSFCRRLMTRLDGIERDLRRDPALAASAGVHVSILGGYRQAVEAEQLIRREATLNVVSSLAGILLLLVITFRSVWLLLAGAVPMVIAVVITAAIYAAAHTPLSVAAASAASLLFGLGIDGVVLLYMRYLEERQSAPTDVEAVRRLGSAGASVLLGMATTAATFFAMTLVDFPSLQQLGLLIGIGMIAGAPFTLFLIPAMLPKHVRARPPVLAKWIGAIVTRRRTIAIVTILLTAGLAAAIPRLHVDLRLERLQLETPAARLERDMAARFSLPRDVVLLLGEGPDLQSQLASQEDARRALSARVPNAVVLSPTLLLPAERDQEMVRDRLRATGLTPEAARIALEKSSASAGFRSDALAPFIDRLPAVLDRNTRLTYEGYRDHQLDDLLSSTIARAGDTFFTVSYVFLRDRVPPGVIEAAVRGASPSLQVTGLPVVNLAIEQNVRRQFVKGIVLGTIGVFALIVLTFRDLRRSLLALLPMALSVIWTTGALALFGVTVDLFSLFGALAFLGVSVDYGIHLVHRLASDPSESVVTALQKIAPANFVAAGIAVLGCGTLVTSSYPPLHSLGLVSVIGVTASLLASVLVLPACLLESQQRDLK
jgi:predicted RND superfamily exporter protein